MTQQELRRLARVGAEARLRDLQREMAAIHAMFPDLRSPGVGGPANPYTAGVREAVGGAVARRRPRLSADARKRIADAQRKRWAEWKAKNSTATSPAASSSRQAAGARSPKKK